MEDPTICCACTSREHGCLRCLRNALLSQLAHQLTEVQHSTVGRGILRHSCGSCGLTDEEQLKIDGFNEGVRAAASFLLRSKDASVKERP